MTPKTPGIPPATIPYCAACGQVLTSAHICHHPTHPLSGAKAADPDHGAVVRIAAALERIADAFTDRETERDKTRRILGQVEEDWRRFGQTSRDHG